MDIGINNWIKHLFYFLQKHLYNEDELYDATVFYVCGCWHLCSNFSISITYIKPIFVCLFISCQSKFALYLWHHLECFCQPCNVDCFSVLFCFILYLMTVWRVCFFLCFTPHVLISLSIQTQFTVVHIFIYFKSMASWKVTYHLTHA